MVAVACWILLALGLTFIAIAQGPASTQVGSASPSAPPDPRVLAAGEAHDREPVPLPPASTQQHRAAAPAPPAVIDTAPSVPAADKVSAPSTVTVDDIAVESVLQPLGFNADGSLEVPATGPRYDEAGWFTGSPRPGDVGPAVLLGHVTGSGGVPSVFYRLSELRPGHRITVSREDGSQVHFEVYRVEQHPKDSFPTAAVYGNTTGPELRLITCSGTRDPGTGRHRDNTIVYARVLAGA